MKNHKLLSVTLLICILVLFTVGCSSFKSIESIKCSLGQMGQEVKSKTSSNTVIRLDLKKGDKVKFTYDSNVKEGSLKIQLTRSKDVVIEDFPINKNDTKELVIDKDGSCWLSANFDNFVGNYRIYADKIN
ncbi:hypothetical protein [Clostridium peptidivorans]|uniref:hypothetical protein n=1 Tax=Clostridium peptidivorans TaxID=100174 RepID=UPI000BE3B99F|nr:hypothetical protein [Clostridium peptidivorans]